MKENNQDRSHDLLVKYMLNEAMPDEVTEVEDWLQASADNRLYIEQLHTIWNESEKLAPHIMRDEDSAWTHFQERVTAGNKRPVSRMQWLRVAAILLVLAGGGWLAFLWMRQNTPLLAESGEAVMNYTLPDGSAVTLNKHASLTYSKGFNKTTRRVTLKGEAFFTVVADPEKPFIVQMDEATVRVLGTSFNVRHSTLLTEVIVETGSVEVQKNGRSVQLKENEKAVIRPANGIPEKAAVDNQLYNYYRTRQFVCNATPLQELVTVLNDAYDVRIVIENESLKELPLTTTFRTRSLDEILEVICQTFDLRIEKEDGVIILKSSPAS